jgi:hypothetical protein
MLNQRGWAWIGIICALIALGLHGIFLAFGALTESAQSSPGTTSALPMLPLDDAYIHLNYARSIAVGQPYRYNPADPPTSGATSLLYPYLIVPGIVVAGDDPLWAGVWAKLIGTIAFACAGVGAAAVASVCGMRTGRWVVALAFMLTGLFAWHAMSGMETMLVTAAALLALYGIAARSVRWGVAGGVLCALLRPEGAILAMLTSVALWIHAVNTPPPMRGVRLIPRRYQRRAGLMWLIAPPAAIGVQPLVNLIMTGAPGSTGGSAKSLLGMIPFDAGVVIGRVVENFVRVWRDLLLGNAPDHLIGGVCVLAIVGWVWLLRRDRLTALVILTWMLLMAGAVATLDTAFWHFRRYQVPLIAGLYPLAGLGMYGLSTWLYARRLDRPLRAAAVVGVLATGAIGVLHHAGAYAINIDAVRQQPYRLAQELAAYPDRAARVAVHDVGLMRYLGGLHTIDMVGLTTPGAAAWWRQGPGAVGQYLTLLRPDLIAAYGSDHGVGLVYLANTDLYAEVLSEYAVALRPENVALAGTIQGIYRPDYTTADHAARSVLPEVISALTGALPITRLDVANLDSEQAHSYRWWNDGYLRGFATEWQQFPLAGCLGEGCISMDGLRRLTGGETFWVDARSGEPLMLVTRMHAAASGVMQVDVDTGDGWRRAATRVIPSLPGQWVDVPTFIPAEYVTDRLHVRIIPEMGGAPYQTALHVVYAVRGDISALMDGRTPLAVYQDGALSLGDPVVLAVEDGMLTLMLDWLADAGVTGDLKRFVHVSDADEQIVAQADGYIAGALPAGSLPPGKTRDRVHIPLDGVPSGTYRVYIGLYDAGTLERAPASGEAVDDARRIFIGQVAIEGET